MRTPQEMCDDILSSLGKKDAPERILLEMYLEMVIGQHRQDAVDNYKSDEMDRIKEKN